MKRFLKSAWTISIGSTVIGGLLLTILLDVVQKISILSTLKSILEFLWKCIISFLNFEIKLWWLLVAVGLLFVVLWIIVKFYDAKGTPSHSSFLNYTQDFISGYWWEWSWKKNWDGQYEVDGLHPICGKCKTIFLPTHNFYGQLKCPRCHETTRLDSSVEDEVLVLIYDNAKKNNFPK